jgi:hypothetical protein
MAKKFVTTETGSEQRVAVGIVGVGGELVVGIKT